MSKVVKSVGRAIGKVVKGVVNVVKSVAKSPIGKVLLAAATVYFGGAAIMGAMGGASASTGFMGTIGGALKGATAGIANAWSGLTGAASAAMGGQFSAAGSSLGSGFTGSYAAGSSAVNAANAAAVSAAGGGFPAGAGGYGSVGPSGQTAAGTTLSSAPASAATTPGTYWTSPAQAVTAPPPNPGIISGAWNSLGDYGKMAAVQGSMQLAGGAIQGAGQQKAMEEQRRYEQEQAQLARNRYNENVGTSWWSGSGNADPAASSPGTYAQSPQTGLVAGYMTPQERYAEDMRRRLAPYNPYAMPTA
jgi:hypothetical protein